MHMLYAPHLLLAYSTRTAESVLNQVCSSLSHTLTYCCCLVVAASSCCLCSQALTRYDEWWVAVPPRDFLQRPANVIKTLRSMPISEVCATPNTSKDTGTSLLYLVAPLLCTYLYLPLLHEIDHHISAACVLEPIHHHRWSGGKQLWHGTELMYFTTRVRCAYRLHTRCAHAAHTLHTRCTHAAHTLHTYAAHTPAHTLHTHLHTHAAHTHAAHTTHVVPCRSGALPLHLRSKVGRGVFAETVSASVLLFQPTAALPIISCTSSIKIACGVSVIK